VKAGAAIAELENADFAAKVKSNQAELSAAEAKLGILNGNRESDLKKAESDVARLKAELALLEPRTEDIDRARADAAAAEAKRMAEDEQKYSDPSGLGTSWSIQLYDQTLRLPEAAAAKLASAKSRLHALEAGSRLEEKDRIRAMRSIRSR
jgi:multidrug efflux pump subunit AcrA (membrane-fusion protein)